VTASFSERHGYRQPPEGPFEFEYLSPEVRAGIAQVTKQLQQIFLTETVAALAMNLGRFEDVPSTRTQAERLLGDLLDVRPLSSAERQLAELSRQVGEPFKAARQVAWYEVLDLCEALYGHVTEPRKFQDALNALFRRYSIGWEMRVGRLERRGEAHTDQVIQEARGLLGDERHQSVNELFEKALGHRNKRPEPDWENCVKDATLALHAMIQVVEPRAKGSNFDSDLNQLKDRIHPALAELLKKLNAYRGDAPRVAHPGDASKRVVEADAEFVLTTSAGAIIYLSKI